MDTQETVAQANESLTLLAGAAKANLPDWPEAIDTWKEQVQKALDLVPGQTEKNPIKEIVVNGAAAAVTIAVVCLVVLVIAKIGIWVIG